MKALLSFEYERLLLLTNLDVPYLQNIQSPDHILQQQKPLYQAEEIVTIEHERLTVNIADCELNLRRKENVSI